MKMKLWKKLGAMVLTLALTLGLAPSAWAADYDGANLTISGSASGSGSQYNVQYTANLSVSGNAENNDIIALVNAARANEAWLRALRFTCYLEDGLLKNAVTSSDLSRMNVSIAGNDIFDAVGGPAKTSEGVSMTYRLKSSVISQLNTASAADLPGILACNMSTTFNGTLTNSEVWSAVGSASSISTQGYVLVTYDPSTSEDLGFNMGASVNLADDTCTTTISPTASGGSSSGGSDGDSSLGSVTGQGDNVNVNVSGSSVTTAQMETAVERADSGETVTIDASHRTSVSLPSGGLENAADNDNNLTVELEDGEVTLSPEALASVAEQAETTVILTVEPVATDDLNRRQQEVVGDAPVFELTLRSGSRYITDFDGGLITVSLPYELQEGQSPAGVVVWYLDDMGNINECWTMYDVRTETVIFTTDHFSKYVIGYEDPAEDIAFVDVDENAWYYDAVVYALDSGLMSGVSDDEFAPNATLTRAMVAQMLYSLEGKPELGINLGYPYADVMPDSWYADAVYWARQKGYITGYSAEQFGPDNALTREQLAVILYNYAQDQGYDTDGVATLDSYQDAGTVSTWAVAGLGWAVDAGLISGRGEGILAPTGTATRAEVAQIFMNFLENVAK